MAENGGNSRLNSALHRSMRNFGKQMKRIGSAMWSSNKEQSCTSHMHPSTFGNHRPPRRREAVSPRKPRAPLCCVAHKILRASVALLWSRRGQQTSARVALDSPSAGTIARPPGNQ